MRKETDSLGTLELPEDVLYGIHSLRARENFPDQTPFPEEWYQAIGSVKKACYLTCRDFRKATLDKYPPEKLPIPFMDEAIVNGLINAAGEVAAGGHFTHFIVPGISGGAGTSINMNVNEIIANVVLISMGEKPGAYHLVDPVEHANACQSTNDVIPTSLKVAVMFLLRELEGKINDLRFVIEQFENTHRSDLRIGYTQMQEAVPTSFGILFSTYNEALSRDWWRISKCFERIKTVNLGGGAIGTGLAIPRYYIMEVVRHLQELTGLPVTRSENMPDSTSNLDSYIEVHAILKSHAVNLEKMVSDIRILASDLTAYATVNPSDPTRVTRHPALGIPPRQTGSSIMPGKINPVIPEFVISAAHKIYSNDSLITGLCAQGCLELNAYLPVIGIALIESLKLLIACDQTLQKNLFAGMKVNADISRERLLNSPVITTALVPFIGYHKAGSMAKLMKSKGISILEANEELSLIEKEKLQSIIEPANLLKMGYSIYDIVGEGTKNRN